jgi:hypothetical protein
MHKVKSPKYADRGVFPSSYLWRWKAGKQSGTEGQIERKDFGSLNI